MITRLLASTALALALSLPALAQTSTTTTDTQNQATDTQGTTTVPSTTESGASTDTGAATGSTEATTQTETETTTQTGETATGETAEQPADTATETQTETQTEEMAEPSTDTAGEPILNQQQPGQVRADTLIGSKVTNAADENVGDVTDLLLDEDGKVVGVILSVGGFLGIGDKHVAVNWEEIELQDQGEQVMISMTKEQISAAPAFETLEDQAIEQQAEGEPPAVGDALDPGTQSGGTATGSGTTTTTE